MIVKDGVRIRKSIERVTNTMNIAQKNLDNLDSSVLVESTKKIIDKQDFKIIELKVSLDENDEEFSNIVDKIQQLWITLQGNNDDVSKAKYMLKRIKGSQYENICLKEQVIKQQSMLQSEKIKNDPTLSPDIIQLLEQKENLQNMLNRREDELTCYKNELFKKELEI